MKSLIISAGILVLLVCFFFAADRLFYLSFIRQASAIRAENRHTGLPVIRDETLHRLPEPVKRYIHQSGLIGKPPVQFVRLFHSGTFRVNKNKDFLPIHGEYFLTSDKPSFCWYGKIEMAPLLSVVAFDSYHNGKGRMVGKVLSVFKIFDERSEQISQSSFGRMVVEMCMVPSFFIDPDHVTWIRSDSLQAECVIKDAGRETTAQFSFHPNGALNKISVKRFYGDGKTDPSLEMFTGVAHGSRNFNGLVLPEILDGYWNLKEGDLHYVHFVIDRVEFE